MSDNEPAMPVPPIRPEPAPAEDIQAKREIQALEKQALAADRQRKEHVRQEKLRDAFAACARAFIVLIFLLIAAALICVTWHYLAPPGMHWMASDALETMRTSLFSGTLFTFFFLYLRDRV